MKERCKTMTKERTMKPKNKLLCRLEERIKVCNIKRIYHVYTVSMVLISMTINMYLGIADLSIPMAITGFLFAVGNGVSLYTGFKLYVEQLLDDSRTGWLWKKYVITSECSIQEITRKEREKRFYNTWTLLFHIMSVVAFNNSTFNFILGILQIGGIH